jgi:hypothetical protein
MQPQADSVLTILGLVIANSTLMFIAHNRHDKLSEHTNRIADELKATCLNGKNSTAINLDKQLERLEPRYDAALLAFIFFSFGELVFFMAMLLYLNPPLWAWIIVSPSLAGLFFHIFGDLLPAGKATKLRMEDARGEWKLLSKESEVQRSLPHSKQQF